MVVKNREKRVTGGGRQEIDVRQLEGDGRRATVDRCEGNWSVMGDERVGGVGFFAGFGLFLLQVQGLCKARSNLFACVVKRSKNAEPKRKSSECRAEFIRAMLSRD